MNTNWFYYRCLTVVRLLDGASDAKHGPKEEG